MRLPRAARRAEFGKVRDFFGRIAPLGAALYDPDADRMRPLSDLSRDLVVIQQPWGMQDMPRRLLDLGILSAYVHYGYPIISNDRMQFGLPDFHRFLWAYVAASPMHRDMVESGPARPHRVVVAGHPKLDAYRAPAPTRDAVAGWPHPGDTDRKRVIFAPHHSLDGGLRMGTFDWSGPAMLALARRRDDIDFLLKPHPNLAMAMARRGQAGGYADWLAAWQALPNTALFDSGAYFDLFRSSDLMITDSGSFLAEYLPTGRPVLRLTRPDAAPMNAAGQALLPAFYTADTAAALRARFDELVIGDADPLAALRAEKAALILPNTQESAATVVDYLVRALCGPDRGPEPPAHPVGGAAPGDTAARARRNG